ncbi:unnamed protein product [Linum tenue]|uniref:non-specific serine/threonine protein kinase n=1 Tax=Linum tenue TaxID=586396 RepID=A0AAV0P8A2_9ROSI|nr:unnamed protein product [Linum tenue]
MTLWLFTSWVLLLLLLQLCFLHHHAGATSSSNETDRLALLEFKSMISDDPLGFLSSWNDSAHFCLWGLSGSISPHIGNLTFLKQLHLYNNTFRNSIPPEIGRLRRLQVLRLSNNSLSGEIPSSISGCSALADLDFGKNNLTGSIPPELGLLNELQFFNVDRNFLTGNIPSSFGNLTLIQEIRVSDNQLSGRVPEALGRLKNLEYFYAAFSELTGSLPASLSNATNMVQLQLQVNNFTGSVPSMASSRNLLRFSIGGNSLGGEDGGGDLSFLSSFAGARNLEALVIDTNNFRGSIPEQIGNLSSSLLLLDFSTNQIPGSIPESIRNLVSLQWLWAHENKLSGTTILSTVANVPSLVDLRLYDNQIPGSIPPSIGNLSNLTVLRLADNRLEGEIPADVENCRRLINLDLSNNNLSGIIPPQIMGLSSLSIVLNLSHNHFNGGIPVEVENLKTLNSLDLSHNMLSNNIPSSLGKCGSLEFVRLQGNLLQGQIPSTLDLLKGIQLFDVSSNNLSGQIPRFFENMNFLQLLNLSYNKFEGEVPASGVLKNVSIISVIGNDKVCGGLAELNLPRCSFRQPKKKLSYKWKVVISTSSSVAFLVIVASCLSVLWMKRKGKRNIVSDDGSDIRVSYQSLHKATDGFSETNLLGAGSFGSVYKGVVDINGKDTTIAIKVFNLQRRGASKSFMAECEVLKNIRHRNLVRIVTVCSGVDYQGNDFKALIYEFVVNGSLENWLYATESVDDPPRSLNFRQRLNIVIHVASALDYIHNLCETPIVHCDLKPSNVLLDEDMVAHVGDFGLATFLQPSVVNLSSDGTSSSSIGIKGTVGYAPPEYGMGNEISTQGDMYSYGILVLEMFTGRRPTDESFIGGLNLQKFVNNVLSEQQSTIREVLDPILFTELSLLRNSEEDVVSIFKIGVACSSDSPQERPSISEVLTKLNKLLA